MYGEMERRSNDVISGLTSAAMIWAASGLGIAVGAGFYFEGFAAVILLIIAVNLLPRIIKRFGPKTLRQQDLFIKIISSDHNLQDLLTEIETIGKKQPFKKSDILIRTMKLKDIENNKQQLHLTVSVPDKKYASTIYTHLKKINKDLQLSIENL